MLSIFIGGYVGLIVEKPLNFLCIRFGASNFIVLCFVSLVLRSLFIVCLPGFAL
jgi:hypothetical protein